MVTTDQALSAGSAAAKVAESGTGRAGEKSGKSRHLPRHLRRLHFFAGIVCAPLIFIASLTGLAYAFAPTLENAVYSSNTTVEVPADAKQLPMEKIVDIATQRHPDQPISGIRVGEKDQAVRVLFKHPTKSASFSDAVFVNPYNGEITGDMVQYGNAGALPLRDWLSHGHRDLWLGDIGRFYSEFAASWLGVLAVSGVYLWWKRQRSGTGRIAAMLKVSGRGRTRNLRWHGALGTALALGMIFFTFTGLTWSSVAGTNIGKVRTELNWATPKVTTSLDGSAAPAVKDPHAGHDHAGHDHGSHSATSSSAKLSLAEQSTHVAATAAAELRSGVTLRPPSEAGQAWSVMENRQAYRKDNNSIAVNGDTGEVTARLAFVDWPFAAQATAWMIQLHMGTMLGLPNQIVLGLLAVGIIILVVRGYMLWFQRRPQGQLVADAPTRARGAERRFGLAGILAVVGMIAYGFLAPVFGVTCLAFVVLSVLWDAVRSRRRKAS
ncbi:PepSY domain-containing protein [Corynebacterium pseudotuberculosis]|uniref:PepSY-associated TM helix domain-containing protein n=1 Tax=Corynebacterium pseudotuberculosis TaxID=1719 RepID=UPI0034E2E146